MRRGSRRFSCCPGFFAFAARGHPGKPAELGAKRVPASGPVEFVPETAATVSTAQGPSTGNGSPRARAPARDLRIGWSEELRRRRLPRVTDVWALQTGGQSRYHGGFGAAHLSLGLQPEHFQQGLGRWEFNNRRQLTAPYVAEMSALSPGLARRLFAISQGRSSLITSTRGPVRSI